VCTMGGVHRWGRHLIKKFRCDTIGDVHDSITYRLVVDLLVRLSLLLSNSTRDFYSCGTQGRNPSSPANGINELPSHCGGRL